MDESRRRKDLGPAASAALPLLWAEMARRGWSDADLCSELDEESGKMAKLLYGDRRPGRQLSSKLFARLAVPLTAWDEPCPVKRRAHLKSTSPSTPPLRTGTG